MPTDTVHDPVCHMDFAPTAISGSHSCNQDCRTNTACPHTATFDANPDAVLQAEAVHHAEPKKLTPPTGDRPWWKFWAR